MPKQLTIANQEPISEEKALQMIQCMGLSWFLNYVRSLPTHQINAFLNACKVPSGSVSNGLVALGMVNAMLLVANFPDVQSLLSLWGTGSPYDRFLVILSAIAFLGTFVGNGRGQMSIMKPVAGTSLLHINGWYKIRHPFKPDQSVEVKLSRLERCMSLSLSSLTAGAIGLFCFEFCNVFFGGGWPGFILGVTFGVASFPGNLYRWMDGFITLKASAREALPEKYLKILYKENENGEKPLSLPGFLFLAFVFLMTLLSAGLAAGYTDDFRLTLINILTSVTESVPDSDIKTSLIKSAGLTYGVCSATSILVFFAGHAMMAYGRYSYYLYNDNEPEPNSNDAKGWCDYILKYKPDIQSLKLILFAFASVAAASISAMANNALTVRLFRGLISKFFGSLAVTDIATLATIAALSTVTIPTYTAALEPSQVSANEPSSSRRNWNGVIKSAQAVGAVAGPIVYSSAAALAPGTFNNTYSGFASVVVAAGIGLMVGPWVMMLVCLLTGAVLYVARTSAAEVRKQLSKCLSNQSNNGSPSHAGYEEIA